MILWAICLTALVWTTTKCEPPVNSYLPPSGSNSRPSSQYGTPALNGQRGQGQLQSQRFQNQPSDSFNTPSSGQSLTSEYGAPGQGSGFPRGGQRGLGQGNIPSSQYGSPNGFDGQSSFGSGSNRPQTSYGTPNQGNNQFGGRNAQRPDAAYGTPASGFQPSGDFGSDGYSGSSSRPGSRGRQPQRGSPSSSYGTPDFGNNLDGSSQNYRGSGVDGSNEPAKYQFSYEVDDAETGTKFGHSEQRDGDVAIGEYNVVLPDGRKQIVEYEADQDGYKPQIRYEGDASGSGSGFGSGVGFGGGRGVGQGGSQGYPRGGAGANTFAGADAGYPRGPGSQGISGGFGQNAPGGQGGNVPGAGYPGRGQGLRGPGFGSGGDDEGYPSGGPNGPRGSGY
ncbi:pro-resilin-like [Pieris napi]|uniref:pro-resilin-like n=1 Tax=Pieris napi TaxID=78633 RepID=UPI001FB91051|nr:pro-resilin-like [Pieris napi]